MSHEKLGERRQERNERRLLRLLEEKENRESMHLSECVFRPNLYSRSKSED